MILLLAGQGEKGANFMGDRKQRVFLTEWMNKNFDRREFLKLQIKSAFCLAAGTSGLLLTKKGLASSVPDISVAKGSRAAATRAAVEILGGMGSFVNKGNRVLIKPNMSFARSPSMGATTHPEVVKELVFMCKEAGASKVLILDHTLDRQANCLARTGIYDTCKEISDTLVAGAESANLYQEKDIPNSKTMSKTDILKEALKADVMIAAPVAKSHSATGVSFSMKGMMGLVYDRRIMHRGELDSSIVDICTMLKADLVVIDGSRVLSTKGPRGPGLVLKEDTIIASRDMVSADAYAVSAFTWSGKKFRPKNVAHIREAHERGLGRMDIENLNIKTLVL